MTFSEQLNEYLRLLDVSSSRLAKASGLSASAMAMYVRGEREPAFDGESMEKLIRGLAVTAREQHVSLSESEIRAALQGSVRNGLRVDYDSYLNNLNTLLRLLNVRSSELAKALSYDPSHISKVLSNRRRPGDIGKFTAETAAFLAERCISAGETEAVALLLGCEEELLGSKRGACEQMILWLGSNKAAPEDSDPIARFLEKMEDFNLDDFIRSIRFDDLRVPTAPFQLPTTKTYTGIAQMMESELDFMKATVLSRSKKDCIMYSDMPLGEMAKNPEFPKKYLFGMAMLMKKGLHLNLIHDVNRPFHEMMLGLEGNIPLYMTGQISPYYLTASQSSVFCHLLKVSGAAALEGHAIAGHQADGKYTLYKSKDDVQHYRRRAEQLLQKAQPLMDIYRSDRREEYFSALRRFWEKDDRAITCSSLPIFTISPELLEKIIERCGLEEGEAQRIRAYREDYLKAVEQLLTANRAVITVPQLGEEQFALSPLNLSLADIFAETDVPYTYEEYAAHLRQTFAFAETHGNMHVRSDPSPIFRNITYSVIGNKQVIVSKNKFPTIHFVIHHKKMVQAFRSFIPPIRETAAEEE